MDSGGIWLLLGRHKLIFLLSLCFFFSFFNLPSPLSQPKVKNLDFLVCLHLPQQIGLQVLLMKLLESLLSPYLFLPSFQPLLWQSPAAGQQPSSLCPMLLPEHSFLSITPIPLSPPFENILKDSP